MVPSSNTRTVKVTLVGGISDASITLDGSKDYSTTSDTSGVATINNVEFGTYTLKVTATGYEEYTQNITINSSNNEPREISVSLTSSGL